MKVRYDSKEEEMFESEYFHAAQLLNKSLTYMRTHVEVISVALYDGRMLLSV